MVAVRRAGSLPPAPAEQRREAVDPVCGMTVLVGPGTPQAGGRAFCCEGCRDAWLARAKEALRRRALAAERLRGPRGIAAVAGVLALALFVLRRRRR